MYTKVSANPGQPNMIQSGVTEFQRHMSNYEKQGSSDKVRAAPYTDNGLAVQKTDVRGSRGSTVGGSASMIQRQQNGHPSPFLNGAQQDLRRA